MGRQVLEALTFLKERGFPTVIHLHSGNVLVQNGVARLAGLENTLLGFTSRIHPLIASRISQNISIDMICFGKINFSYSLNRNSTFITLLSNDQSITFIIFQVICCLRCALDTNYHRLNQIPRIYRTLKYIHKYKFFLSVRYLLPLFFYFICSHALLLIISHIIAPFIFIGLLKIPTAMLITLIMINTVDILSHCQ